MKRITLRVDEQLIDRARFLAKAKGTTLNIIFREWLQQFVAQSNGAKEFDDLMIRLEHVRAGRRFSRKSMNWR